MITGQITIAPHGISMDIFKDGLPVSSEFEKMMLVREIILKQVDDYERNVQIGFFNESKNLPKQEEKF